MKISELLEATMTPDQIAAKKAAAPYGYNPQTGKPNPAPAGQQPQQAPAQQAAPQAKQQPAQQQATPVDPVQQKSNEIEQRMLDRMGARFGLKPGATAEQVQAAQQAYLDKNDPQAAAQYKQNMANIDAGNTAANKPVNLAPQQAQQQPQQQTQPQAQPQTADERLKQADPDFHAGLQAQKAGGSPLDIMLAQPSIANNQKLLDAIGSAYGLPAGSTVQQIKAAAGGQKAQPQQQAVAESMARIFKLSGQI
jgi:hypothetical protein